VTTRREKDSSQEAVNRWRLVLDREQVELRAYSVCQTLESGRFLCEVRQRGGCAESLMGLARYQSSVGESVVS
jgi:hypothetical protein